MATPYRKQKQERRIRTYSITAGVAICLILFAWLSFYAEFLRFARITILPNHPLVITAVQRILDRTETPHILPFLAHRSSLAQQIFDQFPDAQRIAFLANPFNRKLTTLVYFQPILAQICTQQTAPSPPECFFVNDTGRLFQTSLSRQTPLLITTTGSLTPESYLKPHLLSTLKTLIPSLSSLGIDIQEVHILPNDDMKIITSETWYLLIDPTANLAEQTEKLKLTLTRLRHLNASLNYLDLRIFRKVFYQ